MTHIRRLRIVLPARFGAQGAVAAREIAERLVDASHGHTDSLPPKITLQDTGQTPAQIGLQAARATKTPGSTEGGGT